MSALGSTKSHSNPITNNLPNVQREQRGKCPPATQEASLSDTHQPTLFSQGREVEIY